jgi:tRNA(Arg) A34 adenosine deaminase TadA
MDPMARAVSEARAGVGAGHGGPFGAVVVQNGRIIGSAHNEVLLQTDPTAHAEILAIRRAARALGSASLAGCMLYSTCEPCPMCLAAIHWARLDRVVYAETREGARAIGFDDAKFYEAMQKPLMPLEHAPHDAATALFRAYEGPTY